MSEAASNAAPAGDAGGEEVFNFDFGRYLRAVRRYAWLLIAFVAVAITAAVFYTRRLPEVYEATASVQIEPRVVDLLGNGTENLAGAGGAEYYKQQRRVLESFTLLRDTVVAQTPQTRRLDVTERGTRTLEKQYDAATRKLQKMVQIRYPEQNRIMYVAVQSTDPKLAQDVANAHIASYVNYSRGILDTGTQQASSALSAEFAAAEKALLDADTAIHKFQKDEDLLVQSLEDKQSLVSSKILGFREKYDAERTNYKDLGIKLEMLRQLAGGGDVVDSPLLSMGDASAFDAIRAQYYAAKNTFDEIQREFGPKTIDYSKAKTRVDSLHATLEAEARRVLGTAEKQYQAAVQFERELSAEVERTKKEALELGPKIVAYNALARAKKSAEDQYNILVSRLSTSEMTGRLRKGLDTNVRPLDSAQLPTKPVSPNLRVNVMVGSSLALVLGIGIIMLMVFLDRSVKSAEDAQASAGAPMLGIIPMLREGDAARTNDKERDLYVHQNPKSQIAEACRSLRTNIVFSAADRPLKTLVVSSANPREGKTTLALYLGTTMAQSGQRVLVIDTDMRRPRLHQSLGIPKGIGLSSLIVGEGTYEEAIKTTDVPNLFALPCGPLPPNPAEVLMSKRFVTVLAELSARFDRIILDSPPIGAVTDAVVLSKHTDGVAIVVQAGRTLRDDVKRAVRHVRNVNGHLVGVILNQVDASDRRYGYYSTYYGYGDNSDEAASTS